MKKKQIISYYLALQALIMAGCSNHSSYSNHVHESAPDTEVVEAILPETHDEAVVDIYQDDEDAIHSEPTIIDVEKSLDEETLDETPIFELQLGYFTKDSKIYSSTSAEDGIDIERYQKVVIVGKEEDFYVIQLEDTQFGYVLMSDIEILPDTFVEVDISDQTLYFYKDGELFLTSNVVTGKNSTPTRIGYFDIAYKVMDTRLKGPILANGKRAWDNHVDYWMPFDGDRGFHDAYWRDEFGGTIYENSGSHGCVNMPHDAAQELYENAEAQTRVLIHK